MTVCFIFQDQKILLGRKKRGLGEGYLNGYGGRLEENDASIEAGMIREVEEESKINIVEAELLGVVDFSFVGEPELLPRVYIYRSEKFSEEPIETEEMEPIWFDVDSIPFEEMWDGDKIWFPFVLGKEKFRGKILFDENKKVSEHDIKKVDSISII